MLLDVVFRQEFGFDICFTFWKHFTAIQLMWWDLRRPHRIGPWLALQANAH